MGHTVDTYHDIQSLGVKHLRAGYVAANLTIRLQAQPDSLKQLKSFARGIGLDPDRVIYNVPARMDGTGEPHRIFHSPTSDKEHQIEVLSLAIKDLIKSEILKSMEKS